LKNPLAALYFLTKIFPQSTQSQKNFRENKGLLNQSVFLKILFISFFYFLYFTIFLTIKKATFQDPPLKDSLNP